MKLRLVLVLALVAGATAFLLVKGLGDATVFFKNADEAIADRDELGTKRFRLQGTVLDDVEQVGDGVEFDVEFHCAVVHVRHEGDPPELFKPGIPVVLEGRFAAPPSDVYESDKIFVKHTNEYREDRLEKADEEVCEESQ
jgi:cytochrome c-type biogenesis protein CcmE